MNFIARLRNRFRCRVKGHQYHPVCTYMTRNLGNYHFKGKIKLVCRCCQRAALVPAEFQYSEEQQGLLMGYDLPKD